MDSYRVKRAANGRHLAEVPLRGRALLNHPIYNKGTAFTGEERRAFGLLGLLPSQSTTLPLQQQRAYAHITRKTDPLERYIGMASLQDRNETLFYRVLTEHLEELMPIVYTPTVGRACQEFSRIFRRGRGLWLTPEHEGALFDVLGNAPFDDVRLIVVTDNERILGLGDQGAGGMGIPIGKLALYTAAAGIHPTKTLPISLDVGTDNQALLDDELYVGWRHARLRGERYHAFIAEFVEAVQRRFPNALLQWEDFKKGNAFELLHRYQDEILSFNDDIQGTAAVALAGVMGGSRASGVPMKEQRVVILGAGAAGIGIGNQVRDALRRSGLEGEGLTRAVAVLDSRGLLVEGEVSGDAYKDSFRWPRPLVGELGLDGQRDLLAVVRAVKPTVLVGTSGQPGSFDETVVREMAKHVERPVVMPFSNPTSQSEAVPEDILRWTEGRALVATGSPFGPVTLNGKTHRIGQGNNVYIFPGVGLGAIIAGARRITDGMFTVAAETLARRLSDEELAEGALYPRLQQLRAITRDIAGAVAREAGLDDTAEIERRLDENIWEPGYPEYVAV